MIPDEEQAVISAAGIKLISDILHESKSHVIQALAADCIARLAHTRAGRCSVPCPPELYYTLSPTRKLVTVQADL